MKKRQAMTLVESLVALAILSGLVLLAATMTPSVLSLAESSEDLKDLDGQIQRLSQEVEAGRLGPGGYHFEEPLQAWRYELDLQKLGSENESQLWKMELVVIDEEGREEATFVRLFLGDEP